MLPVLYINRDRDIDRRAHIEGALAQRRLLATRIPAVEMASDVKGTGVMSAGEWGCYASHMFAWDSLLATESPYAVVVEDDAIVPPDLAGAIQRLVGVLPNDWDFVHLYGDDGRAVKRLHAVDAHHDLVLFSRSPAGAVGYLISRSGALKLRRPTPPVWPIDTDLRRPWHFGLRSYGVAPPLLGHSGQFASTLGGKRARGRRGIRLSNPLHSPRGAAWNIRRLGLIDWLRCLMVNAARRLSSAALKTLPRAMRAARTRTEPPVRVRAAARLYERAEAADRAR